MLSLSKVVLPQCENWMVYAMICKGLKKIPFYYSLYSMCISKIIFAIIFSSCPWHFLSDAAFTCQTIQSKQRCKTQQSYHFWCGEEYKKLKLCWRINKGLHLCRTSFKSYQSTSLWKPSFIACIWNAYFSSSKLMQYSFTFTGNE